MSQVDQQGMGLVEHGVQEQRVPEQFMVIVLLIWQILGIYTIGMQLRIQKDFVQMVGMCLVIRSGQP
jgi:hypothetical protein